MIPSDYNTALGCFVVSGPSGVGKSTVVKEMIKRFHLRFAVSATTRARRPDESEEAYHFMDEATFRTMEFLETVNRDGILYGTPVSELEAPGPVILDVDVSGAFAVKAYCQETVLMMLVPPSMEELERRIRQRNDGMSEEQILARLNRAEQDMSCREQFDYVFVNEILEDTIEAVAEVIQKHLGKE